MCFVLALFVMCSFCSSPSTDFKRGVTDEFTGFSLENGQMSLVCVLPGSLRGHNLRYVGHG